MQLEEANFILSQVSLTHPCINGYMCITGDQIDEAVDVYNTELESRDSIIRQLRNEIKKLRSLDRIDTVIKYDKKVKDLKDYLNKARKQQLATN